MDPKKRIVINWPLSELWDETGSLDFVRGQRLTTDAIRDRLRSGAVQFVVANSGHPLEWIAADECFSFWKTVVQPRVVPPGAVRVERVEMTPKFRPRTSDSPTYRLEDYPGEFAFEASEWLSADGNAVILLEMLH